MSTHGCVGACGSPTDIEPGFACPGCEAAAARAERARLDEAAAIAKRERIDKLLDRLLVALETSVEQLDELLRDRMKGAR